jgi:outer membrane lipoprotein-sorting protein
MRMRRLAALIAAAMVGFAGAATAAPAGVPLPRPSPLRTAAPMITRESQRTPIERINAYLSSIQTLVGDFQQIGPDGGRTDGQFYIQKPGKVRFEYNPPTPIDVVADGQTLVVRNHLLATQQPFQLSDTPLRLLLSDRVDLTRDTHIIYLSSSETAVTVIVEERRPLVGAYKMKMVFEGKDLHLRQWAITDPQGFETTVLVSNLDTSRKLDPNLFKINYERNLQ